jgi:predicted PurR-regulated permease PerM
MLLERSGTPFFCNQARAITMATKTSSSEQIFSHNALSAAIKIGLAALLVYWCMDILRPFMVLLLWSAILAIGLYPLCVRLAAWFGGRRGLAATLLTVIGVILLLGPAGTIGLTFAQDLQALLATIKDGSLPVPVPPMSVKDWPIVGGKIYEFWHLAATNLAEAMHTIEPQLRGAARTLLSSLASTGLGLVQFLVALIIAGFLMTRSEATDAAAVKITKRLVGERGERLVRIIEATLRNVSRGVLGTAVIQTLFAGIGLVVAGVPGAGLLTVICLFLSIVQIGPALVLIPSVVYMFFQADTLVAVLFLIWTVPVLLIDNILKPILMGRGSEIPVIVIFLGVVGGTLAYGLIGVFIGPVVLAVGYALALVWIEGEAPEDST